ncbi:hypothetical protein FS837_004224 [Tulasnella sp. UAMH 9824]|nr:hypothetical protein FS837_004224 [Tulasnella sp. UAMH 9824]
MDADQLSALKYPELQAIAKKHGIRANGGKEHLVQQLATYFEEQAAASTSRTTRSTSQSFKRRLVENELSTEDDAADGNVPSNDVPTRTRTRSGHLSARTPSISNAPAGSARRTRSRVVSSVAPRAALTRTPSQSRPKHIPAFDSTTEQESSTANATPPPPLLSRRKALDSQRRLGVGRPRAIGGSGVRKSTAKAKSTNVKPLSGGRIVEVVVPTLQAVREEEAAAASRSSLAKPPPVASLEQEEEEEDERTSTPPPPPLRTRPLAATSSGVDDTEIRVLLSTLEGRIEKTESTLETERRRVASLSARVARLEAENRRLRDDLDVLNQQVESGAEKQVVSETPQTPSSREPTPPPLAKESNRPPADLPEAPPPHVHLALAARPANQTALLPSSTDSPSRPTTTDSLKVLRPPTGSNSRSHSPIPPKAVTPAGAKALSNLLRTNAGQSTSRNCQTAVRPQSPAPARKTLGKHGRDALDSSEGGDENGQTSASVNHVPNKRRRVDAEQQANGDDNDVDMDGEPVNVDTEGATENASSALLSARPTASTRASSQPLRSAKGARPGSRTSAEPDSSRGTRRQTRAGSAAPALPGPQQRVAVAIRELETVAEGDFPAGPSSSQQHVSLAPIDPLPLPRSHDASLPPFVSYPLPGDPVKQLKPLTHFDSGTEFFGTQSKRNYRTDWHEGTVFDDPFDAETVRRAQGIAAEEVQGGFGPQGLDSIVDGLEERDEQESLGVRGMMSFAGEDDPGVDLSGGL